MTAPRTPEIQAPDPAECLASTTLIDHLSPAVQAFARRVCGGAQDPRERAILLYTAVRDGWRYDPYVVTLDPRDFTASQIVTTTRNWCVPKAVLLAAGARAMGIPAAVGLADVTNHFTSDKLRERMGTDVFYDHGYAGLWLGERWVRLSPAFNRELCDRMGVEVLPFDGHNDAMLQAFDRQSRRFMVYQRDHGLFADLPLDKIQRDFTRHYPNLLA